MNLDLCVRATAFDLKEPAPVERRSYKLNLIISPGLGPVASTVPPLPRKMQEEGFEPSRDVFQIEFETKLRLQTS